MKCINKKLTCCLILITCLLLSGCGQNQYAMKYNRNSPVSAYNFSEGTVNGSVCEGYAADLCVVTGDVSGNNIDTTRAEAALLCDEASNEVLYSKNAFVQLHPASLTKVMTALVALKYGNLDDELVASSNVEITESGATLVGIKPGDKMTLSQALYCLLIPSGNDAAIMIAEHIGGSVESFCDMMNKEAQAIGATGCHFVNPHGLTDEAHYVTAYDIYLIFREAMKYDAFVEVISTPVYTTVYYDREGMPKEYTCENTNYYLNGNKQAPQGVTVIGGKTGTTNAAKSCLVLLSKDTSANPYISVIMKCDERGILYDEMTDMLGLIK